MMMGWIAKFKLNSAQLATVIGEREIVIAGKLEEIKRCRADVPAAAIRGDYLPEHTLAALNRELMAEQAVLADLRTAHARALQCEQAVALANKRAVAEEKGRDLEL